jgi:hypothetical protein
MKSWLALAMGGMVAFAGNPALAQLRLLGFASAGLADEGYRPLQSQDYQQVSAAREFIRNGETDKALSLLFPLQSEQFAPAIALLGSMYASGRGVVQDDVRAAELYRQAAEGGDAVAMYLHGYALDNGFGVAVQKDEAQLWMQRASRSGQIELQRAVRNYRKHVSR